MNAPALSPREKVAQMVMPDFRFEQPDTERITDLVKRGVGGVCLYGGSVFELTPLVNALQRLAKVPLLVASDFETGAGHQVSGATKLPSNMAVGATGSEELAQLKGRVTADEARALGVRWVFAPVLDLQVRAANPIINVRSFGSSAALVTKLGRAYARGLRAGGVLSCGKHWPGHGDVALDSHLELPVLDDARGHVEAFDETLADLDGVMTAHLLVKSLDAQRPVSLSAAALAGLRNHFEGLLVTDALIMGGVTKGHPEAEAIRLAAAAGNDVILYPGDPARAIDVLEEALGSGALDPRVVDAAVTRILAAKRRLGLMADRITDPEGVEPVVGSVSHHLAADRIAEASVTRIRGGFPHRKVRLEVVGDELPVFREELQRRGALDPSAPTGLLAVCVQVRAFHGKIRADEAKVAAARARLAGVTSTVVATFGSPYDHASIPGEAAFAVYDATEASQRAAARALVGEIPMPGVLPVTM